ncbi:MAG: MerR family transcriptional regulator [Arachidicoccus sp.]|nr:MerR family transcriptional regulator [Arachidicoccus sp.]
MQQLSLFDFGDEQPKERKKQNNPKKEKSGNYSSGELFAQDSKEEDNKVAPDGDIIEETAGLSTDFVIEELEEEIITNQPESNEEFTLEIVEENIADEEIIIKKRGRKSFKEIDKEVDLIDVPSDEELFQKQYYPISIVAKWFRVNTSLLRFWENQFKILKPKKNKKGDRFFRPEDVRNLKIIYYLLRQKKLTIDGANKHLKAHKEHTEENLQLINSLNNFKNFLLELKANI